MTLASIRGWLERQADHRWAVPALCALSFLDACVSPVLPETLLVPLCVAKPKRRWWLAWWCGVWSVIGGVFGYAVGALLWDAGLRELAFGHVPGFTPEQFESIASRYGEHAFLWVFLAGLTPLPFKVFAVAAGVCHAHVGLATFVAGAAASRIPRFVITVALLNAGTTWLRRPSQTPRWAVLLVAFAVLVLLTA